MRRKYGIDQVSVRLVKEAPILSEEEISTPEDAIRVLGDAFKDEGVKNLVSLESKSF